MKTTISSLLLWLGVALLGAAAIGGIALNRGESINAIWFVTAALCVYAIAYRFYAAWIAATIAIPVLMYHSRVNHVSVNHGRAKTRM